MRNDAAVLNKLADYYLNVDDDMLYTCPPEILQTVLFNTIKFAEENNAGTVILGYPSHENPFEDERNDGNFHLRKGDAWASMGMILKNIYNGNIVPEDALKCLGGNDDVLMADCRTYLNNMPCYYYGVALGHHTDIKEVKSRSMQRLNFKVCDTIEGSCRRYINDLRNGSRKLKIVTKDNNTASAENKYLVEHVIKHRKVSDYLNDTEYLKDKTIFVSLKDSKRSSRVKNKIAWLNIPKEGAYIALEDRSTGFKYEKHTDRTASYAYSKNEKKATIVSSSCKCNNISIFIDGKNKCYYGEDGLNFAILDANTMNLKDIFRVDIYSGDGLDIIR